MFDGRNESSFEVARLCRLASALMQQGGALESAGGSTTVDDATLASSLRALLQDQEEQLAAREGRTPTLHGLDQAASDLLRSGHSALQRIAGGASATTLSDREYSALEGIVQVTGRPALRYLDGAVQAPKSKAGANEYWHVFIATARKDIDRASRSVGRVGIERGTTLDIAGTAWRLGTDLLITNRHVARRLIEPTGERDPARWKFNTALTTVVDFASTDNASKPARFRIVGLRYAAPEPYIDFAVLQLDGGGATVPLALPCDPDAAALGRQIETTHGASRFQGEEVYVVGHPYRVESSAQIKRVFGTADGNKRCAPGYVTALDPAEPLFEHDCSTLGGNSGSCVLSRAHHRVVGLHFGSRGTDEDTGVADTNLAVALARLGQHRAASILVKGTVEEP